MKILETLISFNSDHEPTFVETHSYYDVDEYAKTFEDVDYKVKIITGRLSPRGFITRTMHSDNYKISLIEIERSNKIDVDEIYTEIVNRIKKTIEYLNTGAEFEE
jgi:hypothetical protein